MTLAPWLVWLLPLIGAPLVALVSLANERACKWFAVAVGGVTAAVAAYTAFTFSAAYTETLQVWVSSIGIPIEVKVDGLSVLLSAFVALLSFAIIVYAASNMRHERGQARFYSLVLLFVGAMLGLVLAGNLVQLYFFWEIVGICSALLIAFWNGKEVARRAGFKAFIVTRFGDVALLLAVLLTLTTIHTTSLDGIASAVALQGSTPTWTLIGVLVLIGAMGKSAQVPLHTWLPDAMEGPTPVSALIHAATMVNAGVYLIVRLFPVFNASTFLMYTVLGVGLLSMVVGALGASAADDLKRVLAYSTISQLGLMFAAVGLGSWAGATYQLISQGIFKALAFMAAGSVIEATGTRKMDEMGGLRGLMKYTYVAFVFSVLAMVGLPPLVGFWTKDAILASAFTTNVTAFLLIALASILTSFYSFRALIKTFHGNPKSGVRESPALMLVPMMVLAASVVLGIFVLAYQNFIPSLETGLNVVVVGASITALVIGLGFAYVAFFARKESTATLFQTNGLLRGIRSFLLNGLGFDRFYSFVIRSVGGPLISLASDIQSGVLGLNIALFISAILALLLLTITGVI